MKFIPDAAPGISIQSHGDGWVKVQGQRYTHSILIHTEHGVQTWEPLSVGELKGDDFDALLAWKPELVLLGSGHCLRFPSPQVVARLYAAGIGIETMDTPAACRTFNFLAAEGRRVVAALLVEPGKPS